MIEDPNQGRGAADGTPAFGDAPNLPPENSEQAARSGAAVRESLDRVTHDFNSLLTAIVSGVQLGLKDIPPDSHAAGALRTAQDAARQASQLTQQLRMLHARVGQDTTTAPSTAGTSKFAVPKAAELPTGHETILIVDDAERVLSHISAVLKRIGYRVLAVESSKEAMDRFLRHSQRIDAVVTDLVMPEFSGRELLQRVRATGSTVPVVLMTGHGTTERREQVLAEGFADLLAKPFRIETLAHVVRNVLDEHRTSTG